MNSRTFSADHQQAFAELSGDANPLHVDPLIARRTLYGRPVVHGIHLLLWALGELLPKSSRLTKISVNFSAPVGVDELVSCITVKSEHSSMEIALECRDARCALVKIGFEEDHSPSQSATLPLKNSVLPSLCKDPTPSDLKTLKGHLDLALDEPLCAQLLSSCLEKLPRPQITILLATTRLIGMECPGLNSIFSQLNLEFQNQGNNEKPSLEWQVDSFDERFSRILIKVAAPDCTGTLAAFLRPKPPVQPALDEVKRLVPEGVFNGQRALVVGGSRGIGEVCSKILATGGAEVRMTYRLGGGEAEKLVAEMREFGADAKTFALDVTNALSLSKDLDGWLPTHLYYFPTPAIFVGSKGKYSHDTFNQFYEIYVKGLGDIYNQLRKLTKEKLEIFYPSSIVLDEMQASMGEYAVAKAAGETFCRFLVLNDRNLSIKNIRLPRLMTDQTSTVVAADAPTPLDVLLSILLGQSARHG